MVLAAFVGIAWVILTMDAFDPIRTYIMDTFDAVQMDIRTMLR